jgi:serine-type D-Ala-D-Ala carboxypeptidase (penicillin-binding protein 5/6)
MTDLRVLQEGRMRRSAREARSRRLRRRRRLRRASILLLALGIVLLVLHVGGVGSSTKNVMPQAHAAAHKAPRPSFRSLYARAVSPVRVNPHLTLPLASGLLFDVGSGQVLWSKNPNVRRPIASLTKMMTALVVVAHSKPGNKVMITKQAVDFTGSGVGLLPLHKRVGEKALLYGLLLPSGNDAAIALAQHVARTQTRFIALMNKRVAQMHLSCTHYSTVSGVIDQGNYSCATDLAVIAHAVLTNRTLKPIVASRSAIVPFPIKGGKLYLYNNNPLLEQGYPGVDGVKTGFTDAAGLCIVAAARQGRSWLAVVLLHSGNWATQATTLLNAGFAAEGAAAVAKAAAHRGKKA